MREPARQLTAILRDDLPSLALLLLLVLMPAFAVLTAGWTDGLWVLSTVVLFSLLTGYLLAISMFSDLLLLLITTVYGTFAVWALSASLLAETLTFRERLLDIAFRISIWIENTLEGGFSRDNLIFVLFLCAVSWYVAFNAAVNTFRTRRLWYATIPPGLALLINNFYYYGDAHVEFFLIGYLFLTFTLAARTNVVTREQAWRRNRVSFTPGIRFDFVRAGVVAGVLLVIIAWFTPTVSASNRLSEAWDRSTNPWHRVRDTFDRLFGGVEGGVATTADYYGGATLTMGGPVNLGNHVVMVVYAPEGYRYYWRSKVFNTYDNGRWGTTTQARITSDFGALVPEDESVYQLRRNVQQSFDIVVPATRLVYAAPQPVSFSSLPVIYDVIFTLPGNEYGSAMVVRAADLITAGQTYGATSSISLADEASLRAAGTDYPTWVTRHYLGLPDTITERTIELGNSLAAPFGNPYDRARAIEDYLRKTITYNDQVDPPPRDVEPVDYLLFERQEGYCNYFASAMVILLRTQGIPSRIAAGFSHGAWDGDLEAYRVTEADAHTWVEVYFPQYGWIEFEPTAAEEPIIRVEERADTSGAFTDPEGQLPDGGAMSEEDKDRLIPEEERNPVDEDLMNPLDSMRRFRVPRVVLWVLGVGVALVVGVAGTWYWFEQRGLLELSEISRSYARLNIYAPLVGVDLEESATPYERAGQIVGAVPEGEKPIHAITQLYVDEQYGPPPETPMHADRANTWAREAWPTARRAFLRAAVWNGLARLNPFKPRQSGPA